MDVAHTPGGLPVFMVSVADVMLPTLTIWGQPIGKSRIQLQSHTLHNALASMPLVICKYRLELDHTLTETQFVLRLLSDAAV